MYEAAEAMISYGHATMKAGMRRPGTALGLGTLITAIAIVALSGAPAVPAAAQGSTSTAPATTAATTAPDTTAPATTAPATTPATTAPATTTTRARLTTTTAATTSTTAVTTTSTAAATSSVSGGRIAAIVIIVVIGIALVAGLYFLIARNRQRSQWASSAQVVSTDAAALATAVERGIPLLRDPNTAAQVWVDLNNRAARLRSALGSLSASAPDQRARAATTRAKDAVESLLAAIDTDRGLRMAPSPPTDEQIAYSEALLSQRAAELRRAAQDIEPVTSPA
jgi:hypothetical protein